MPAKIVAVPPPPLVLDEGSRATVDLVKTREIVPRRQRLPAATDNIRSLRVH